MNNDNMSNQKTKKSLLANNQKQVVNLLEKLKPQMALALPAHMTADRMARIALTEYRKTPKLLECDPMSVAASVMVCAQLGLEIGVLGQAYLVPYNNRKKGTTECQFILGYKGMIDLARRSGQIISIAAHCVYSNDEFHYEYGLNEDLKHVPTSEKRKDFIAVYAVAKLVGGGYQFEVLTKADVEDIRRSSKAGGAGPWAEHFDEMARKSAIRKLFKYLPASVEMQKAVAYEEKVELPDASVVDLLAEDFDVVIEGEDSVDIETGEVKTQADTMAQGL